jgi:protein-disulfide isomerase
VLEQYPNDVKLVFKNFPLTRIHKAAMNAAIGALAAHQQGKFWEFHTELFKNYNKLNDAKFDEIATNLELDMDQFKKDMQNPALAGLVQRDLKDGAAVGVRGTPSIFVNGRQLKQRSLAGFKAVINAELAKGKKDKK